MSMPTLLYMLQCARDQLSDMFSRIDFPSSLLQSFYSSQFADMRKYLIAISMRSLSIFRHSFYANEYSL